jgi:hypothetical protein
MTKTHNDSIQVKILRVIIGVLIIIIFFLLGWRLRKFTIFGVELAPPSTSTSISTDLPTSTYLPSPASTSTMIVGNYDVLDDFSTGLFDPSIWERVEGDTIANLENGVLSIKLNSKGNFINYMLLAQLNGKSIKTVATEVKIVDGSDWGSAGIVVPIVSIENQSLYIDFGISVTSVVYIRRGVAGIGNQEEIDRWDLKDVNTPHLLRIEWTGHEVAFFVDGKFLTSIPSNKPFYWTALFANANSGGSVESEFDWAGWNY